jgi:formate dehydrogenase subunit delta
MNPDNLVRMANSIGAFFEAMPDHLQAVADVAGHISRSWEPRMRRALLAYVDNEGGAGLSEIVREALANHRAALE